jgi:hypothetical protein
MKQHPINSLNNFIMGWYIDPTICDELIEIYKNSKDKQDGLCGVDNRIDKSIKDSIDIGFLPNEIPRNYLNALDQCAHKYLEKYSEARLGFDIYEYTKLQYYPPGGGFKVWHMERGSLDWPMVTRHLVFMTYLNDVTDGGGTEFLYQNTKTTAEKGLTLIWPAEWTHTHRGEVSPTQEKYIITGWFNMHGPDQKQNMLPDNLRKNK